MPFSWNEQIVPSSTVTCPIRRLELDHRGPGVDVPEDQCARSQESADDPDPRYSGTEQTWHDAEQPGCKGDSIPLNLAQAGSVP